MAMQRALAPDGSREILYGMPPFGWRLSTDRTRLVEDKDEHRIIAIVRHMYFVQRLTMRDIVELLAETGVRNRRGTPYVLSRIYAIVHDRGEVPAEAAPSRRRRR